MICVLISLAYVAGVIIAGSSKGGELLTETSVVSVCLIAALWEEWLARLGRWSK